MKTIGQIIKSARLLNNQDKDTLESKTKIKSSFIESIENEQWDLLPPFPTVLGFVKSIANALNIDEHMAVATLKRDYPPKKVRITPKPDVANKFLWSPKLTFTISIGVLLFVIFGYLTFQYIKFTSPPTLIIESPLENQIVETKTVSVFGKTDTDTKVLINNQPVLVTGDGEFSIDLEVAKNTLEIIVSATSRSGKETVIHRKIEVR